MDQYLGLDPSSSSSSCKSCSPDSESSTSDHQALIPVVTSSKRKAGRKKFKETRHPVFRGVRQRKGNKWVCEVREPHKKSRIWLGTFPTPEMAAKAYDVAALALRGNSAALNFTDSALILPRAKSPSPKDIQTAALAAAESFRPTTTRCDYSPLAAAGQMVSLQYQCSKNLGIENNQKDHSISMEHNNHESLEITKPNECNVPLFIDEDALFNMPGLLNSMAEGMLITPPTLMQRQVDYWDEYDETASTINIDLWGA